MVKACAAGIANSAKPKAATSTAKRWRDGDGGRCFMTASCIFGSGNAARTLRLHRGECKFLRLCSTRRAKRGHIGRIILCAEYELSPRGVSGRERDHHQV